MSIDVCVIRTSLSGLTDWAPPSGFFPCKAPGRAAESRPGDQHTKIAIRSPHDSGAITQTEFDSIKAKALS